MKKEYSSAQNFRTALLERIKKLASNDGKTIQRLQRQVAYDRLLCRLFSGEAVPWILKGGHVMELRIHNSRATKDIDLALKDMKIFNAKTQDKQKKAILARLQEKASLDLKDFFEYIVSEPVLDLDAAPYGGARFPVEAQIDGKTFSKFHLDVGIGDVWIEPHDKIKLNDWLSFAGIDSIAIPVISKEQHFAEKLHAYTLPRDGAFNSRVKDLVDLVLLVQEKGMKTKLLQTALAETFTRRKTHKIPPVLVSPPKEWKKPFAAMAEECQIELSVDDAFEVVRKFYKKATSPKES